MAWEWIVYSSDLHWIHDDVIKWKQFPRSVKCVLKFYHFHSRKCIWKCRLPKWRPFCPGKTSWCHSLKMYQLTVNIFWASYVKAWMLGFRDLPGELLIQFVWLIYFSIEIEFWLKFDWKIFILTITQHCFVLWPSAAKQQAITWTSVEGVADGLPSQRAMIWKVFPCQELSGPRWLFLLGNNTEEIPGLEMSSNAFMLEYIGLQTTFSNAFSWMKMLEFRPLKFVPCDTLGNKVAFVQIIYDDVIKWKHFPHYWPFVREIHRSSVNSPHKGQWRGGLIFSLICAWKKVFVNNREAGDLRRHLAHNDVTLMKFVTNRRQTIVWTKGGSFYWCLNAPLSLITFIGIWRVMENLVWIQNLSNSISFDFGFLP